MNHVRADRWYKTGRTILYGRLEDEAPFQTVRRLVQYEDYALRVMRDAGIPTAAPLGIVELTPEREYLLVTEFFDGAVEIGDAEVDDQVIDEGLALVRRLWNAGLAHRDIKPANLMVKDGHLLIIDVAFAQVRPSPWREAVDLANMMLVLAVRSDAERVYERALVYFSPDEIAEAFAAARGIASPSQLRSVMKRDGRDLVGQFRKLAPERRPISLQRWGPRRILMAAAIVVFGVVATTFMYETFTPAQLPIGQKPTCGTDEVMILMAQAVPTATAIPCLDALPAGWTVGGVRVRRSDARFWLDSDQAGHHAVEVSLRPPDACSVDNATEVPSDEPGRRRFEEAQQLPPELRAVRTYLSEDACVTYRFELDGASTRRRRWPSTPPCRSNPAPSSSTRSSASQGSRSVARARRRASGAKVECRRGGDGPRRRPPRGRGGRAGRRHHQRVASAPGDAARVGHGPARRRRRLGDRDRRRTRCQPLGLGCRRPRAAPRRHRHLGDDGHRGRVGSARSPGFAGDR